LVWVTPESLFAKRTIAGDFLMATETFAGLVHRDGPLAQIRFKGERHGVVESARVLDGTT
jgi:hypothetical protein